MTPYWKKQMEHDLTRGYYETLVKIIEKLQPVKVLEIGTGWGISGSAFMDAGVQVYKTIDPNVNNGYGAEGRAEIESRKTSKTEEVVFLEGRSQEVLPRLIEAGEQFDFIFIDGDHAYDSVRHDLFKARKLLAWGGRIVCDDYLHEGNFVFDKRNCGVSKAVRDYLLEFRDEATIWPHNKENGFIVI